MPYNLFLHAAAISQKWKREDSLTDLRIETGFAVVLGVGISMLIVVTSAMARQKLPPEETIDSVDALIVQLRPLAGNAAGYLMGIGYFAAGLSSALTAPLAAGYAARGLFGWSEDARDKRFVAVWLIVLACGVATVQSGVRPTTIIMFAQVANALILPAIGLFLLRLVNSQRVMGDQTNGWLSNVAGSFVMLVLIALCAKTFIGLWT